MEEGRKDEEERSVEIICAFLNRVCLCVCVLKLLGGSVIQFLKLRGWRERGKVGGKEERESQR